MNKYIYKSRFYIIVAMTSLLVIASLLLAFAIRFDFYIPDLYWTRIAVLVPVALVIKLLVYWFFGCFRGWWRYVSMPDLIQIFKASVLGSLFFVVYCVLVYRLRDIPRSVLVIDAFLCFLFVGGVRFATRAFRESYVPFFHESPRHKKRLLIVGAGDAGRMIVREIISNKRIEYDVIGFIDDDQQKQDCNILGVTVLGPRQALARIVREKKIDEVIIAIPSATGEQIRELVSRCEMTEVKFKILPGVAELIDGKVSIKQVRDVDLNDLLGREPISLDKDEIRCYLHGKCVLVSGAGGSIGSEICRQVAGFGPQKLILFDQAETPLFFVEQELARRFPDLVVVSIIGDVCNAKRVDSLFSELNPRVVFHAAAYKHVPMMELNPAEAVLTNVQGTRLLADAADRYGVEKFVMISTDKAVRPTNVMGASKRTAELYVQSLNARSRTGFVTTRFGNVLGSNGSVIPIFNEQIAAGGPVTVTHPDVTRFFMTIPEATQLVLQAGSMGDGGEIYLFDMGQPVKIQALAEELIRLSGLQPHKDIRIVYTGLRPGEKLYEELLLDDEGVLPTLHEKICIARSVDMSFDLVQRAIEELVTCAGNLDVAGIMSGLRQLVPEYSPVANCCPEVISSESSSATGR